MADKQNSSDEEFGVELPESTSKPTVDIFSLIPEDKIQQRTQSPAVVEDLEKESEKAVS